MNSLQPVFASRYLELGIIEVSPFLGVLDVFAFRVAAPDGPGTGHDQGSITLLTVAQLLLEYGSASKNLLGINMCRDFRRCG
jgi:hypothetical protein